MARVRLDEAYKKEYCQMLIEHMDKGLSFESFAAVIGCTPSRLNYWLTKLPDWQYAKELGEAKSLLYWEKMGIEGLSIKGFGANLWQFWMRNRFRKFGWKDKFQEDEHELVKIGPTIQISNDQIAELIGMAKKEINPSPKQIEPEEGDIIEPEQLKVSNET